MKVEKNDLFPLFYLLKMFSWQFSYSWPLVMSVDSDNLYPQIKTKHEDIL